MKSKLFLSFSLGCLVGLGLPPILSVKEPALQPAAEKRVDEKIIYQCPDDPADSTPAVPEFAEELPERLQTNPEGEVRVAWKPVPYADRYQVTVKKMDGKAIKIWKTSKTVLYLKEIPFADSLEFTPYKITVTAVNRKGISGDESLSRDLKVHRMNSVLAPAIKSIVVED